MARVLLDFFRVEIFFTTFIQSSVWACKNFLIWQLALITVNKMVELSIDMVISPSPFLWTAPDASLILMVVRKEEIKHRIWKKA